MIIILGYRISFKGLPKKDFACSATIDNYSWTSCKIKNRLEISLSKSSGKTVVIDGKEYKLPGGTHLACIAGCDDRQAYCDTGVVIEITTVAVRLDGFDSKLCELTKEDAEDNSVYLLPALMPENTETANFAKLLNKYINHSISDEAHKKALCISVWFELLSSIDESVRRCILAKKHKSENYYVKKLDYIIETKYSQNLSLSEIAKDFGISMSYLSTVYKTASGQTFRDAIFCTRMNKVKKLIRETDLSIEEISKRVGLCDETYLRKRFKSYFGVSISQFRKIDKELTLYHDKPLRK